METNTENLITITPRITANPPVLQDIEVTENGEYKADGSADGLGTVTVNVQPDNEEITITENGEYTPSEEFDGISKVTVDVQPQINLETLNVDENGTYTPQTGFDGFGEVNVNIPAPVLDDINITENGEYNPVNDGFSKVTVDVPDPVLDDINITENGNYVSEHDGFNNVTVAVPDKPLETKNITENGSYSPSQGIYGFSQVTIDVQPDNEEINVVQNGIYTPSANKDGFSKVNVAVPDKPLEIKNIISNGQYTPSSGYYGFSEVNVNVQPNLEEKTITENGRYTPSSGYYGFSQINVDIETYEPPLNLVLINPVADSNINLPITFHWNINNLEQGETPVYYLFVDDVLVYKGNNTSYTMQAMPIAGRNHTCYVVANTTIRSSFTNSISFNLPYEFLYGFDIDQDVEDPTSAITYTDDCLNFTPAGLDNNDVFQYGSWKLFIDRICRPVMLKTNGLVDYELDHDNLNNKLDGTLSDITNMNYDGNAMVEFKKVYTKVWQENNTIKVRFCDVRLDMDYQAWAFVNDDGNEQDEMYVSMFHAISDTDNTKLMSISNSSKTIWNTNNITNSNNLINIMPSGYKPLSYSILQYIRLLHILISKSRNSLTSFGYPTNGYTMLANSAYLANGGFCGTKQGKNYANVLRSFYIEQLYSAGNSSVGGFYTILDGIYLTNSFVFCYKNTRPYPTFDNFSASGYINSGLELKSQGTPAYLKANNVHDGILIPNDNDLTTGNISYNSSVMGNYNGSNDIQYVCISNITDYGYTRSMYGLYIQAYNTSKFSTFITYIRPS